MTPKGRYWMGRLWREWCKPLLAIVIVMGSLRSAVADWNYVPTGSMKPTILEGDRVFVNKAAYGLRVPFTRWRLVEWGQPERGDVVVLFSPVDEVRLVKRVIGIPGDRIALRNNRLFVNGEAVGYGPLDTETVNQIPAGERGRHRFASERLGDHGHPVMLTPGRPLSPWYGPVTVPEGMYFLMGDNRDDSGDSRVFGFVQRSRIVGRTRRVVMSLDGGRYYLPRWDRFWHPLP